MIMRAFFVFALLCSPVWAQEGASPQPAPEGSIVPPPKPAFELADNLDGLFEQLKRTRDAKRGDRISKRIWSHWQTSDRKSIDLLTGWARAAMGRKEYARALDLLDQVVVIEPDYAEGWNQRATLHFIMENYVKSVADIEKTLTLEPRHFGALAGLAQIQQKYGDQKGALNSWYRVLAIYPSMKNAQNSVLKLEEELAGSGI